MATEILRVLLQMEASQYKREAREASTATGKISQDLTRTQKAIAENKKEVTQFGKAAVAGLALAGGAAVAAFAKDTVRAASDLNESINAVQVTFGDAADGVLAIGENAADSFGLAQSEFNSFAVQFSAFATKIADQDGRDVANVLEEMTGRISDFASVMNLEVAEAAEKFRSGLAGETEPLRQFGIDVSAAAVNQKALALGLAASSSELTEQDKILARYQLIMEQTEKTAGDFANTQDEFANATRRANAQLEDSKAQIGNAVIPVLGDMAAVLAKILGFLNDINVTLPASQKEFSLLEGAAKAMLGVFGTVSLIADAWNGFFGGAAEAIDKTTTATELSSVAFTQHLAASRKAADVQEEAADAFEGTTLAVQDAAEAIQQYDDAFRRLTDPVFRHLDDQARLQQAYEDYADVLNDAEASTQDQESALFALLQAQQEVNSSGAALPATMARTEAAFAELARQAGLTDEQVNIIRGALEAIDGNTYRADIEAFFKVGGNMNAYDAIKSGQAVQQGNIIFRASGGPVSAGSPYVVGEAGPELFVPSMSGTIIPNHAAASVGSPMGGVTYVFNGDVYGDDGFMRKVREANVQMGRLGMN